jgi:hypothetical protein
MPWRSSADASALLSYAFLQIGRGRGSTKRASGPGPANEWPERPQHPVSAAPQIGTERPLRCLNPFTSDRPRYPRGERPWTERLGGKAHNILWYREKSTLNLVVLDFSETPVFPCQNAPYLCTVSQQLAFIAPMLAGRQLLGAFCLTLFAGGLIWFSYSSKGVKERVL